MILLESANLWKTLQTLAQKAKKRMAAVAYFSQIDLLPLLDGDILVVDASTSAISSGQTSAEALGKLYIKHVQLYSCTGLHAKTFLFDDTAIVGSNNVRSTL